MDYAMSEMSSSLVFRAFKRVAKRLLLYPSKTITIRRATEK
jgi:hypothetical protein